MCGLNYTQARPVTTRLLEEMAEGIRDRDELIKNLLMYLSESDVEDFAEMNGYLPTSGEEIE